MLRPAQARSARPAAAGSLTPVFLAVDLAFFGANIIKLSHGAWFPLAIGAVAYTSMRSWRLGRTVLARRFRALIVDSEEFMKCIADAPPQRVPGTAVFMTGNLKAIPPALVLNMEHNKVLHEKNMLLTILTEDGPRVDSRKRVELEELENGFYTLTAHYVFMEDPHVPRILRMARRRGLDIDIDNASFFLGRERLLARKRSGMPAWREKIFAFLARNALGATAYFHIPSERVMEVGAQIEI